MTDRGEKPIRVAMLGAFPPQCQGVQEYCRAIAEALSKRCIVHAIGFRRMYPSWLFPGVKTAIDPDKPPMHGKMLEVEHRLAWYNPISWLRAGLFTKADIFHLQWWSLPLFPVSLTMYLSMRLRGKPVVVTIHNVRAHEGGGMLERAGRFFCKRADAVIVHGKANRERLIEGYGVSEDRAHVMPMPAYENPMALPTRNEARESLGIKKDARLILFFGIIRPYKGVDVLIEAFTELAKSDSEAHLIIAGRPWCDFAPYQKLIDEAGLGERVTCLLDYLPDEQVAQLFAAVDLGVLPYTHFDAQSAVGAQFIAHGIPLLVSNVGGLPEWVGGDPAWIISANDVEAWSSMLKTHFTQKSERREAFAEIAAQVREESAPDAVADQHILVYEKLMERTKSGV